MRRNPIMSPELHPNTRPTTTPNSHAHRKGISMRPFSHITLLLALLSITPLLHAQYIEDGLRLAEPATMVSSRSASLGNAFTGLADDYSALFWNPAGLGQMRRPEFVLGMNHVAVSNDATFLGLTRNGENTATKFNSIGFALPFPVARGSLVIAAGYNKLVNYENALSIGAFNGQSSIFPSLFDADERYDLPWHLGLESFIPGGQGTPSSDSVKVRNNVFQSAEAYESGDLNQWAFGGSVEVAPNILVGLGLNILTGEYTWERTFIEEDVNNAYADLLIAGKDFDRRGFRRGTVDQNIYQELSGWNLKFGFLYNHKDLARVGLTIQTPSWMTVKEDYTLKGSSLFAEVIEGGSVRRNVTTAYTVDPSYNDYEVTTPWVFTLGASGSPLPFLTLSGDAELIDYTQMRFDNASASAFDIAQKNRDIRNTLRAVINVRVGLEVTVPRTGLAVRGGFGLQQSPYKNDPSDYNRVTLSGGLGYTFGDAVTLNIAYQRGTWKAYQLNYSDPDLSVPDSALRTDHSLTSTNLLFGLSWRF